MVKQLFALIIATCVLNLAFASISSAQAAQDDEHVRKVKILVNRLGVSEKSRVTVTLRSTGKTVSGYISEITPSDFAVTDKKHNNTVHVQYTDAKKVYKEPGKVIWGVAIAAIAIVVIALVVCGSSGCD